MQLFYRILADFVVVVHAAYVLFILLGLFAILLGGPCKWDWVRNRTFRLLHLAAILFVVAEAQFGITCPLTVWEQQLRQMAGQEAYEGAFIANLVHDMLFFENTPTWVFTVCYTAFGVLVLGTLWLVPPKWRRGAAKPPA